MAKSTSNKDKVASTAHLVETTAHHLSHTLMHAQQLKKSKTKAQRDFNQEHMDTHLKGGIEHVGKLMNHLQSNYPAESKELTKLQSAIPTVGDRVKAVHKKIKSTK